MTSSINETTCLVSQLILGARTGGAGGFAKGLSLGLVGIVTRPLSGAVDFASSTLDAVRSLVFFFFFS